jgi:hypothetical protein
VVGVVLRCLSLLGKLPFTGPAALVLLLAGTVAAAAAVQSGMDAHGPVENTPGSRDAVVEHEHWGERTRNVFLAVAVVELAALFLARRPWARFLRMGSAALGLVGLACLYEAGEHGGELVYSYAGGVGIKTGDPADVGRLLLAGLYHQSQADRKAGRAEEAAALVETALRRFPADMEVQLMAADSLLIDRKDPAKALALLAGLTVPADQPRLRRRHALLTADALLASGQRDAARAALQSLLAQFPETHTVRRKLDALGAN